MNITEIVKKIRVQCYLSCDGTNLSICSNLKLAPVPFSIPEWPIGKAREVREAFLIDRGGA